MVFGRGNGGSDTNFLRFLLMDRGIRWITSTSGNTSASYCSLLPLTWTQVATAYSQRHLVQMMGNHSMDHARSAQAPCLL